MARRKKQNEDQPSDNLENTDDSFGLPEIEYEPLKSEDETQPEDLGASSPVAEDTYGSGRYNESTETNNPMERNDLKQPQYSYYDEDDERSSWPRVLGILAILMVVGGGAWYYFAHYRSAKMAEEKARQEQLAREEEKRKEEELRLQREEEERRRIADSLANLPPPSGEIVTLTERTGRYYVIIASSVDGDLIMDYAKKLSPKGLSPKVIPPRGKVKFYRLAIADGDTWRAAQATADQLKGEYGDDVWVVKY